MPALTGHTEMARKGIHDLGYPAYFGTYLTIMKVIGSTILIAPQAPAYLKEWAYVGIGITLLSALVSQLAVNGFEIGMVIFISIVSAVLAISYVTYHQIGHRAHRT
jgi:hypothetical protein